MAFTVSKASDLAAFQLEKFIKPTSAKSILRHLQKRPLLRVLEEKKEEYGSGKDYVREGVMGALMKNQAGFYVGIEGDDVLAFKASDGGIQTQAPIRWMHAGFMITHDELLDAGIHIVDGDTKATTEEKLELMKVLDTRLADFGESTAAMRNQMLWRDGTQDAKAIPGIFSILREDPTAVATVLGISTANTWWRNIAATGVGGADPKLVYSKADQTLTEGLDHYFTQLCRYGGEPNVWLAGSDFVDMVKREARAKGQLTVTGWSDAKTGILVKGIQVDKYSIEYDPTLDDLGFEKRCVCFDSNHLRLRPQKMEWGKITNQNQPNDQFVMLKSVTDRGALSANQLDCSAIFDAE
jgi:hypothetical protein